MGVTQWCPDTTPIPNFRFLRGPRNGHPADRDEANFIAKYIGFVDSPTLTLPLVHERRPLLVHNRKPGAAEVGLVFVISRAGCATH